MAAGDVSTMRRSVELREVELVDKVASCKQPSYLAALGRAAEVLNIDIEFLEELLGGETLANDCVFDFLVYRQLGHLFKRGLVERTGGGLVATPKLIYLYGLYRRFSPSSALQQSGV